MGFIILGRNRVDLIAHTQLIGILLGERIASLVEDHGLVVFLFEKFEEFDFLIHFPQSLLQAFVFSLEFSEILAVHDFLTGQADLRVRLF